MGKGFKKSVRAWYMDTFPDDDVGKAIPGGLTFGDVDAALDSGGDVYELLDGAADSVVRERVFGEIDLMYGWLKESCYARWMKAA